MEQNLGLDSAKRNSFSERVRQLKDRLRPKEIPVVQWDQWRQTFIAYRETGVPEDLAPQRFNVSRELLDTFQEMLPIRSQGVISSDEFPDAARIIRDGLEVSRSLILDRSKTRLLVQINNGGESQKTEEGAQVLHTRKIGEVGGLHTHPSNGLPTSSDVHAFIYYSDIVQFVVTPYRVFALFKTDRTPTFPNFFVARGYIKGMGISKGRISGKSDLWSPTYKDYQELHILAFEAQRGKDFFVRKDDKV